MLLCLVRFWVMPLGSSLWVDEMGTAFVVRHGAGEASLRAVPQVPASLYYLLPRATVWALGDSEAALRAPSALAMALALWLIARIASMLIHPHAGWFAAFVCVAFHGFDYQAADARPYGLGTLVASAAMWALIKWLDRGRWRDAVLFAAMAALLWRIHLIFWPAYAAFVTYAVVRLLRRDAAAGWRPIAVVGAACAACLLPVAAEALRLYRNAPAHVVAPLPTASEVGDALHLGLLLAFCSAAALASRWKGWAPGAGLSVAGLALILGWWLSQPLCLSVFSWLTGNSVFVPRYLFLSLPGTALLATAAVAAFLPPALWKRTALVFGCGVLLTVGHWNRLWPLHHRSDWRSAATALNKASLGPDMPIICPSPFVEAVPPVWTPGYSTRGFLYSHLAFYPIRGRAYPFPFEASPEAERFASALVQNTLKRAERFVLYGGDHSVLWWRDWLAARPDLAGWNQRRLGSFGDVDVVIFDRQAAPAPAGKARNNPNGRAVGTNLAIFADPVPGRHHLR